MGRLLVFAARIDAAPGTTPLPGKRQRASGSARGPAAWNLCSVEQMYQPPEKTVKHICVDPALNLIARLGVGDDDFRGSLRLRAVTSRWPPDGSIAR